MDEGVLYVLGCEGSGEQVAPVWAGIYIAESRMGARSENSWNGNRSWDGEGWGRGEHRSDVDFEDRWLEEKQQKESKKQRPRGSTFPTSERTESNRVRMDLTPSSKWRVLNSGSAQNSVPREYFRGRKGTCMGEGKLCASARIRFASLGRRGGWVFPLLCDRQEQKHLMG